MSEGRAERRLAAILAVDVAGYSRLMGEDEEGTLAALRAVRRELSDPKIALRILPLAASFRRSLRRTHSGRSPSATGFRAIISTGVCCG
jgi:hypothetical protein